MDTFDPMISVDMIRALSELTPGWRTAVQAGWECGGESIEKRREVRLTITKLTRAGILESLVVTHRDEPLMCVRIDPTALRAVLDTDDETAL
jgi:hypothetical protein